MPLEEKRKLYKKKKFVVIDELETWPLQASEIMRRFGMCPDHTVKILKN